MKWFRFYTDVLHNPKVQQLHPATFKHWINILCLANKNHERGILPPVEDIAFGLRVKPCEAEKILSTLVSARLLDRDSDGRLFPHNWTSRQREGDAGATRQQRYREKKKLENSELLEKVTSPSRNGDALDTDTDTDKTYMSDFFEKLWGKYPKKDGKKVAERHYKATVKKESDMDRINLALGNYLTHIETNKTAYQYIKNGSTWFNNWQDWEVIEDGQ